jgi:excisionase family DNA binding protein
MNNDEILTIKELATYLKIAEKTAYRFVCEGKLPGFRVGSAWRFKKQAIDEWININNNKTMAFKKINKSC